MNKIDESLLKKIIDGGLSFNKADAYNLRSNMECIERKTSECVRIESKKDNPGINIYVDDDISNAIIDIPVIVSKSGIKDIVYNDFYIGKNSNVTIYAGCGIHNPESLATSHDGIHEFHIKENAKVKYIEKHYAQGLGNGKKILNPSTIINMKKNSYMVMDTVQISGVDSAFRKTKAKLGENATLIINEKILTNYEEKAKSDYTIYLNGKNSSVNISSKSVAESKSYQEFKSNIIGNNACYGHVECNAILKDNASVKSIPKIFAKNTQANLIHEAYIGKIAGDQLMKLMTLGLNENEAEKVIIDGFLKS